MTKATTDTESSRSGDLSAAAQSPLDYTAVPIVGRWAGTEPGKDPGRKHVTYELMVPTNAVVIDAADNNHLRAEFVTLVRKPNGKSTEPPSGNTYELHLNPDRLAQILKGGIRYRGALDLAPGEYSVRFIVRDDLGGRMGSVVVPLKVQ